MFDEQLGVPLAFSTTAGSEMDVHQLLTDRRIEMLEGKLVNLRIMEKVDLPLLAEWLNSPEFLGGFQPLRQLSKGDAEKILESPLELKPFIIEKKDRTKIGFIAHFHVLHPTGSKLEIGYTLVPSVR